MHHIDKNGRPIPMSGLLQDNNALCACGSNVKYRKCCKKRHAAKTSIPPTFTRKPGSPRFKIMTQRQLAAMERKHKGQTK